MFTLRQTSETYPLCLWPVVNPLVHKAVSLQREYTADLEVNSLSSLTDVVVFPSGWNELSLGSLFYSLES